MARSIHYYHPVVDLISSEEKEQLKHIYSELNDFLYFAAENDVDVLGRDGLVREPKNEAGFAITVLDMYPLCWDIVKRYNAKIWTFGFMNKGFKIYKHTDYKESRKCAITFPLYPDYAEYADTNFYDFYEQEIPSAKIRYSTLRKPCLINVNKFHEVEQTKTDRLAFQIQFDAKFDFKTVRSQLQARKLLSTPV